MYINIYIYVCVFYVHVINVYIYIYIHVCMEKLSTELTNWLTSSLTAWLTSWNRTIIWFASQASQVDHHMKHSSYSCVKNVIIVDGSQATCQHMYAQSKMATTGQLPIWFEDFPSLFDYRRLFTRLHRPLVVKKQCVNVNTTDSFHHFDW